LAASARHLGPRVGGVKDQEHAARPRFHRSSCLSTSFRPGTSCARFSEAISYSMRALFLVIDLALEIYIWVLIVAAIFSWLVAFNVVNVRNSVVGAIGDFLYRVTEPVLRPIRSVMPNLGGIDISPVILILIIIFIRYCIALYILPYVF